MALRRGGSGAKGGATPEARVLTDVVRQARTAIIVVFTLSFFINLSVLVSPLYMQNIFDRVLQTHHTETLVWLTVVTSLILVVLGVLEAIRGYLLARIGRWWDETLREPVLHAASEQARLTGRPTGQAVQDVGIVRNFIGTSSVLPFFDAPWMPLFIGVIALIHPLLGLIALVSAVALVLLAYAMDKGTRTLQEKASEEAARSGALAHAMIRNADSVHAMGMQATLVERYKDLHEPAAAKTLAIGDFGATITGVTKFVRLGVQIMILGIGAWLVIGHQLSSGGMIAASIILGRALAPAEQALGAWRSMVAARAAYDRLSQVLSRHGEPDATTMLPAPTGTLDVEGVSYLLPGQERPVLRQVSFKAPAGSVIALIGPSASGKSTLCRILIGSWLPSQGQVRLDDAAVTRWNRTQAARHIGYMAQTVELFAGSVKENIARFTQASDADIVSAAKLAGCHEMILRLPEGYETQIGEGGAFLSGGQRQRIGLARAVFGEPKLVVLDEPNSNLDNEGEMALLRAVAELRSRKATVVIVSHRTAALNMVDFIGILREGQLERFGERDAVLHDLRPVSPLRPGQASGPQPAMKAAGEARPA